MSNFRYAKLKYKIILLSMEVDILANIKSAKKRILVNKKKYERNKSVRSEVKTYIKNVESSVEAGNKDEASKALIAAVSVINKAASKGIYHKNNAARKVSRLSKAVNQMA